MTNNKTFYSYFKSPVGPLILTSDGIHLTGLLFYKPDEITLPKKSWILNDEAVPFATVKKQLATYFKKQLKTFDLPMKLIGTPFQKKVWQQLQAIPYGETISYAEQARRLGNPKAARAVGNANGRNPISIIVPCHRVIASNNSLGGYGGGLPNKKLLLSLEQ